MIFTIRTSYSNWFWRILVTPSRVWAVYRQPARFILPEHPTVPTEDMEKSAVMAMRVTWEGSGTIFRFFYATKSIVW